VKKTASQYVVSFERERLQKRILYHWIITKARNPEELVSWGSTPTLELAEATAGLEVERLEGGRATGGRVKFKLSQARRSSWREP
jgi:hypothetical protein